MKFPAIALLLVTALYGQHRGVRIVPPVLRPQIHRLQPHLGPFHSYKYWPHTWRDEWWRHHGPSWDFPSPPPYYYWLDNCARCH